MRLLELPGILRGAGLKVHEMDGWKTSGKQLTAVRGVVAHHTATKANTSDEAVERLLRNGRPDLAGPLCQLGLRRSGTWVVVASGKANHNGYGKWGNESIGVEAYNDGVGERWPQQQYDSFVAGCRALSHHFRVPVLGHKETDPGRKIDPTFDMAAFRAAIDAAPAPPEDDDMPAPFVFVDPAGKRWVFMRGTNGHLYVNRPGDPKGSYKDYGGELTSGPTAAFNPDPQVLAIEVVARGNNGAAWLNRINHLDFSASGWSDLGGQS